MNKKPEEFLLSSLNSTVYLSIAVHNKLTVKTLTHID